MLHLSPALFVSLGASRLFGLFIPRTYLAGYHEVLAGLAEDVAALGAVAQAEVAENRVAEGALLVADVAYELS